MTSHEFIDASARDWSVVEPHIFGTLFERCLYRCSKMRTCGGHNGHNRYLCSGGPMVLKDHKRKGKKLLPPLLASATPLFEGRWQMDRLPEVFWIALLCERLGKNVTLDLVAAMCRNIQDDVRDLRNDKMAIRAYRLSEHVMLSADEQRSIVSKHKKSDWRTQIAGHIADMRLVWPTLPIGYLAPRTLKPSSLLSDFTLEIKRTLERCNHRHEKLALSAQAIVIAVELQLGNLFFAEGLDIPDLNAVFDYPDTEESKHAAGFVVTTCQGMIRGVSADDSLSDWCRTFWNACYTLEPCEYCYAQEE